MESFLTLLNFNKSRMGLVINVRDVEYPTSIGAKIMLQNSALAICVDTLTFKSRPYFAYSYYKSLRNNERGLPLQIVKLSSPKIIVTFTSS